MKKQVTRSSKMLITVASLGLCFGLWLIVAATAANEWLSGNRAALGLTGAGAHSAH